MKLGVGRGGGGGRGRGEAEGAANTQVVVERKAVADLQLPRMMTAARDAQMEFWVLPERPQDCRW